MKKNNAIEIHNISKQYRLGLVGTGTLSHDFKRWWHLVRGKEDPYLKIGDTNDRATKSDSGYVWALKDINFEVKQGEVLGIIGKNGAGKSTLLKILSKVTGPTTGRIDYKGRIGALLEVGTGFHPELTGRENIYLNGAILGMTRQEIKNKFDEIVDFSGCGKYVDTPVKRYSSGMTVRLGFAVAAFLEPEILVIDEVLAVGDAEFQQRAVGKMKEVSKREGRTVLFVSHNMATIESLCTKAVLLKQGGVEIEGDVDYIISNYLKINPETASNAWKNPDLSTKDQVVLLEAKVLDNSFNLRSIFSNMEDVIIEMKIDIRENNQFLKVGLDLLEEGWKKLFTSFHNDWNENNSLQLGENILRFTIPKHLLNKGFYTINLSAGIHRIKWIFEHKDVLGFSIDFKIRNQLMPVDNRPGSIIAPLLKCELN